jgi:hypothetical protein
MLYIPSIPGHGFEESPVLKSICSKQIERYLILLITEVRNWEMRIHLDWLC